MDTLLCTFVYAENSPFVVFSDCCSACVAVLSPSILHLTRGTVMHSYSLLIFVFLRCEIFINVILYLKTGGIRNITELKVVRRFCQGFDFFPLVFFLCCNFNDFP